MVDCETWYELIGQRYNEQRFSLPLTELAALRRAVLTIRRRNPAFHLRLLRPGGDTATGHGATRERHRPRLPA